MRLVWYDFTITLGVWCLSLIRSKLTNQFSLCEPTDSSLFYSKLAMTAQDKPIITPSLPTDDANYKDTKIKLSKPTQNSEINAAQLGLNQQIFVREWIKNKRERALPNNNNKARMTEDQSLYIYMRLIISQPKGTILTQNGTPFIEWYIVHFLSLNVLILIFFFPLSGSSLPLYTSQSIVSWPFISTYSHSPYDTCPFKLLLKVVE